MKQCRRKQAVVTTAQLKIDRFRIAPALRELSSSLVYENQLQDCYKISVLRPQDRARIVSESVPLIPRAVRVINRAGALSSAQFLRRKTQLKWRPTA